MPPAASRTPTLLSARVSLIRLWSSVSPPYSPRTFPRSGASFPPRGSLGLVPPLLRYYQALRLPAALPRRFVAFAPRYRRCALGFAPAGARRSTHRPGGVHRTPQPVLSSTETTGPPRFLEDPTLNVPCSLTPAGP